VYVWAKATKNMESPTVVTPVIYTPDSPNRVVARPDSGANRSRAKPNIDTTAETPNAPTPNDSAYWGKTGVIIPNPIAMMKAAAISIRISPGILSFSNDADIWDIIARR